MKASVVLLFVGAVLLAAGSFTNSWLTAGRGEMSMNAGLREAEICTSSDDCTSISYLKVMDTSSRARDTLMAVSGMAAFILGIVAMLLSVITGGLVLAKTPKSVLGILTIVGVGLAGAASFAFVGSMEKGDVMNYGFSMFAFEAGFIAALIGGIMSLTGARAGVAGPVAGAVAGPPCPRCARPATFVQQYQRHFCTSCNTYL